MAVMKNSNCFRVASASAEAQSCPHVLRQSKRADLGIVGGESFQGPRPRHYILHGAARAWSQEDVTEFFESVDWTDIEVMAPSGEYLWTLGERVLNQKTSA